MTEYSKQCVREAQRAQNPFRLTDAGVWWLITVPLILVILGLACVLSELIYLKMLPVFVPENGSEWSLFWLSQKHPLP